MNKALSVALLIVGVILLIYGFSASDSVASNVSEAVQGAPSNKTIWLISLGVIFSLVGLGGTIFSIRAK